MRIWALAIGIGLCAHGPLAAQTQVPETINARVNELVAACVNAGGTLGRMDGQGRFVIPADFTGDGVTDFVVSEGNVPCTGRPNLFRADGLGRVQLFAADRAGGTRLMFDERLLAYRVLAGSPAKLQIARRGTACGTGSAASTRCGDELRWNAAAGRFDMVATDGRPATPVPVVAAGAQTAPAGAAPGAAGTSGAAGPAGAVPAVTADARSRFMASCRKGYMTPRPQTTDWIDGACAEDWKRVEASQPAAQALLQAVPASGAAPALAELKSRVPGVRWAARPRTGQLASGQIGTYAVDVEGKARPEAMSVSWGRVGEMLPLDVPAALAARGATLSLVRCEKMGVGEGERAWSVALPGRAPFELTVYERTAPTANANSSYAATARLDGRPPTRGPTACERFW